MEHIQLASFVSHLIALAIFLGCILSLMEMLKPSFVRWFKNEVAECDFLGVGVVIFGVDFASCCAVLASSGFSSTLAQYLFPTLLGVNMACLLGFLAFVYRFQNNSRFNLERFNYEWQDREAWLGFKLTHSKPIKVLGWYAELKDGRRTDLETSACGRYGELTPGENGTVLTCKFSGTERWPKMAQVSDFSRVVLLMGNGQQYTFFLDSGSIKPYYEVRWHFCRDVVHTK